MRFSAQLVKPATVAAMLFAGVIGAVTLRAQSPTPGAVGAMGPAGGLQGMYSAINLAVSRTVDGVRHVYDLAAHRGKHPGPNPFVGLRVGQTVVVQYSVRQHEGLARAVQDIAGPSPGITEGTVRHIDPQQARLTVRFTDGYLATFQMLDRPAAGAAQNPDEAAVARRGIVIDYVDESGQRVVHVFKEVPPKQP